MPRVISPTYDNTCLQCIARRSGLQAGCNVSRIPARIMPREILRSILRFARALKLGGPDFDFCSEDFFPRGRRTSRATSPFPLPSPYLRGSKRRRWHRLSAFLWRIFKCSYGVYVLPPRGISDCIGIFSRHIRARSHPDDEDVPRHDDLRRRKRFRRERRRFHLPHTPFSNTVAFAVCFR